ncbi:hypothetical protein NMY22_g16479 [Coprinellus aureogranulatus]|nr:hypothetical protein NMY22_g16479 [Coprinellus aureogranulatus]
MARLATVLSVLLSAATMHSAFASPSCAYRYKGKPECLEKCKQSWGWSDGLLNSNPWGSVVVSDKVKVTIEAYIAQACGSSVPAVPSSTSAAATTTAAASVTPQAAASTPSPSKPAVTSSRSTVTSSSAQTVATLRPSPRFLAARRT